MKKELSRRDLTKVPGLAASRAGKTRDDAAKKLAKYKAGGLSGLDIRRATSQMARDTKDSVSRAQARRIRRHFLSKKK